VEQGLHPNSSWREIDSLKKVCRMNYPSLSGACKKLIKFNSVMGVASQENEHFQGSMKDAIKRAQELMNFETYTFTVWCYSERKNYDFSRNGKSFN
jgi:hypothetical protein